MERSCLHESEEHLGEWNQLEVLLWTHSYYCVFIGRWRNNHECECGHVLVCMVTKYVHLEGLETGLSLSYSPSGSTSVLSAMRQTVTVLLDRCSKRKAAQLLVFLPSAHHLNAVTRNHEASPLEEMFQWSKIIGLLPSKILRSRRLKNVRRQLEGLGFSTSTIWSPGIKLRLFGLTASLCLVNHPPGPQYVLWATLMERLVCPLYCCRKNI